MAAHVNPAVFSFDYSESFRRMASEAIHNEVAAIDPGAWPIPPVHHYIGGGCITQSKAFDELYAHALKHPEQIAQSLVVCRSPMHCIPPSIQQDRIERLRDLGAEVVTLEYGEPDFDKASSMRLMEIVEANRAMPSMQVRTQDIYTPAHYGMEF